ncbi:hypothetical protein POM88_019151 [Heracleum sosnowskyi]|uniref:Acetyl-coenzyme A synthetase N-terminal domain-containing protein n=1 Tax=Heracleum sosnowskyi TaxID=360622 RepID=A0AAD8ITX0_9APIA|nr:hypothetical protein POM88_019151 [Heracleum sosnowskyi]
MQAITQAEMAYINPENFETVLQSRETNKYEAPAFEEDDLVFPSPTFSSQALVPSFNQYMEMYKRSVEDPSGFWSDIAAQFYWKCRWDPSVYSGNLDVRKGNVNSFSIF